MDKREWRIVITTGLILLLIFTFTDLQISLAIAKKPGFARVLEVVGEIPFTILTLAGCGMMVRFRNRSSVVKEMTCLIGGGVLFLLFSCMGGFMTWNYLNDNIPGTSKVWIPVFGVLMAGAAAWITIKVPAEKRNQALRYAITALVYFILVIIVMNTLKTMWGRMRFREMTDPLKEFTRWYEICGRGSFDNTYASFPSGHSMNSVGIILMMLLPDIIPALKEKKKLLHILVYVWCIVVGFSRVFMGAHFASDVTVGILLSFIIFEVTYIFIYKRNQI